ncbi:Pentatricopeptide repeat-containing protein [Thalictrum thalictroides]|uniref:Pentatricopeptide repeat-containing protein n=1 Tax=Thalictrum thalictroides TaxID=46969 RepID=A0A7J6UXR3_THATH|nr:Pentatricopeptide repeat-containing protein [Thalictrum thalictroides]
MPERNLVSWTSMISGFIQNGEFERGLEFYVEMMGCGYQPNEFALGSVLRGCASMEAIGFGSSVHSFILKTAFVNNYFVGSSVIYMYAKCGVIEAAEMVFESMGDHDVGCWNAMIGGYALNGYSFQALKLTSLMQKEGVVMDQFTFMSAIKGCSLLGDSYLGREVHGVIIRRKVVFDSSGVNSVIDMYFKVGRKDYGLKIFNKMRDKDIISWNTVLSNIAQDGNSRDAMNLFSRMLLTGLKPNHVTFSGILRSCGLACDIYLCFQLHSLVYRLGFLAKSVVANSLIDVFCRCGEHEIARSIFDNVFVRDIATWNEMILGYKLNGCTKEAINLFSTLRGIKIEANEFTFSIVLGACLDAKHLEICRQIHGTIIRSGFGLHGFVCSSLINAYARFGKCDDSFKIFNGTGILDLASWGAMVSAFVLGGRSFEAIGILNRLMEAGEYPDEFILGSVMNGCANITAYHQTKSVHSVVIQTGFENHVCVASAVIDAYAKCGDIESSRMAFLCASRNYDTILFNTMIMAYAHHGLLAEAIEIFETMKLANLQPTHTTFVSVISLCSHLGLVDLGCRFFDSISLVYKMVPSAENFGSLVDLFSRNGFLEEAKHVLEVMPFVPWPAVCRSLLNGCRIHGNKNMGEWVSKQLLQLVPENDATYVLLTNVYSQEGNWDDAAKVGRRMLKQGVQKYPGCSWIEI